MAGESEVGAGLCQVQARVLAVEQAFLNNCIHCVTM